MIKFVMVMDNKLWNERRSKCPFCFKMVGRSHTCRGHGLDYIEDNICSYKRCPFVFWSEKEVRIT